MEKFFEAGISKVVRGSRRPKADGYKAPDESYVHSVTYRSRLRADSMHAGGVLGGRPPNTRDISQRQFAHPLQLVFQLAHVFALPRGEMCRNPCCWRVIMARVIPSCCRSIRPASSSQSGSVGGQTYSFSLRYSVVRPIPAGARSWPHLRSFAPVLF
jgi:hypothetical protein